MTRLLDHTWAVTVHHHFMILRTGHSSELHVDLLSINIKLVGSISLLPSCILLGLDAVAWWEGATASPP